MFTSSAGREIAFTAMPPGLGLRNVEGPATSAHAAEVPKMKPALLKLLDPLPRMPVAFRVATG